MPEEQQDITIYSDAEDLHARMKLRIGKKNTVVVGELGCLSIVLYDDTGCTPLAHMDYRIEGPGGSYSGTTDEAGYLFHPDVPIDDYDLTVGESTVKVPVVLTEEERHLQRVIDFEIP